MSSNYSAGQYNDAITPKRLGVCWDLAHNRNFDQRPRQEVNSHPTKFIATNRGHLLPGVPRRNRRTAWGCLYNRCLNYSKRYQNQYQSQYEADPDYVPVTTIRFPVPSYFNQKRKRAKNLRSIPRNMIDPYLNYLRLIQLPTIWVIGMPTERIKNKRKKLVQEVAQELDYCYIDIQDQIGKWVDRQFQCSQNQNNNQANKCQSDPSHLHQHQQKNQNKGVKGRKLRDRNSNQKPIPSYRSSKPHKPQKAHSAEDTNTANDESASGPNSGPNSGQGKPSKSREHEDTTDNITFDTSEALPTSKILQLLKFAMVEGLPCKGFVLDGFPCNLEEAGEFERIFYPSALAMYFVAGAGTIGTSGGNCQRQNSISGESDPIIHCRRFRRRYQFNVKGAEDICRRSAYGRKVIKVIETENVDKDTFDFLYKLVRDNLEKYPEILSGNAGVDFSLEDDRDSESECN